MVFVMTSITKKNVIMMVVTAAVYLFKTIFVLIARVNVSETQTKLRMISLITTHEYLSNSLYLHLFFSLHLQAQF